MNSRADFNGTLIADPKKRDLGAQIADYVAQQPENIQAWHRRMKRLEVGSLGLIVAAFIAALYVSFNWSRFGGATIAAAWFAFPASVSPVLFLIGLHTVILRAYPPIVQLGENKGFRTGRQVSGQGWGMMIVAVISAAFCGLVAYLIWSGHLTAEDFLVAMDILGPVVGVGVAIAVIVSLYRRVFRSQ